MKRMRQRRRPRAGVPTNRGGTAWRDLRPEERNRCQAPTAHYTGTNVWRFPLHRTFTHLPGLTRVTTLFVNAWLVDAPDGWVLVDTGLPGYSGRIVHAAELR